MPKRKGRKTKVPRRSGAALIPQHPGPEDAYRARVRQVVVRCCVCGKALSRCVSPWASRSTRGWCAGCWESRGVGDGA